MTTEQKLKAVEMREQGFTLQQIADELGYSRQNVCQQLRKLGIERGSVKNIKTIIYKGLADWMIKNDMSINMLAMKIYKKYYNTTCNNLIKKLRGERVITMQEIKKILEVTGMTFEECFEERELENV